MEDKMTEIIKSVLPRIKPTKAEENAMKTIIEKVIKVTEDIINPMKLTFTISGSFIRNTWLPDKKEFDLFILFPTEYSRTELCKTGLEIGTRIMHNIKGSHEIAYAEHPYTKGRYEGFDIDIVPCYKVKNTREIISAVDRTPFHNEYMKKNITDVISDEVRLLKKFTKSIGVYGSDVKVMGFSGYLCEILILQYGSFLNLVKSASLWETGILIDLEKHCEIKDIKITFKGQPLIAIDPTDPKRNVAAAVSPENFMKFIKSCESFVKKPSKRFFMPEKHEIDSEKIIDKMKERKTRFIGIEFKRPQIVDDIIWSQIRRTAKRIANILIDNEFYTVGYLTYADKEKIIVIFEMETWILPAIRKIEGPPIFSKKHSEQFITKYSKLGRLFVEGDKWVSEIKRNYESPEILLKEFFRKNPHELMEAGIASKIAEVSPTHKILRQKKIEMYIKADKGVRNEISSYMTKDFS